MDDDLQRLEAVLGRFPDHRALPDVDELLAAAGLDASVLADERAHKLLLDAITTRPFGQLESVAAISTEVEVLVLEVRELTAALRAGGLQQVALDRIDQRLTWAQQRLEQLQSEL